MEITLIDRRNFHLFQPLVYQVATGALAPGEIATPLRAIFKRNENVRVLLGEVSGFDLAERQVELDRLPTGGPPRGFPSTRSSLPRGRPTPTSGTTSG